MALAQRCPRENHSDSAGALAGRHRLGPGLRFGRWGSGRRSDKRSIAFMILALDEPVPESVAERIGSYEGMLDVWLINLDLPA